MYNTPEKHRKNIDGRSKFDFSDIDHLDRATEAFMKEQRKALGHRAVNLDAVAEQGKRALVFVVLGAVFVTALVAGVRFGFSDDALRDPNTSVSDSVAESSTNQTTDGSSSDQSKNDANGAATTATSASTTSVVTEPTTDQADPALSTALPQLTDSNIVILTTISTADTNQSVTTSAGTTTRNTTTTPKAATATTTSTTKKSTSTTSTTTSTTTRRSTTTTTTTTTTTSTTTTTTTTTTAAPKANLTVKRAALRQCEEMDDGNFRVMVQVELRNTGNAAASNVEATVHVSNCTYVTTSSDGWSAEIVGGRPVADYDGTVAPNGEVNVILYFITNRYLSSCEASCTFQ